MKNILFTLVTLVLFSGCNHKPKIEDNPGAKSADESISVSTLNNQKDEKELSTIAIKKGDIVKLIKKEEWDSEKQQWIKATKTSIFSDKRSLTDEHLIAIFPNGTEAEVTDIYEERLNNGTIWRVYKVKTKTNPSNEGWIADFNIVK